MREPHLQPGVQPPWAQHLRWQRPHRASQNNLIWGTTMTQPRGRRWPTERRISYVGIFPSVTMRDRNGHHWGFRDAATAQVVVTADQDSARMAKVVAVPIKCCRTVFTEHCRHITNDEVANTLAVCASQ